MENVYLGREPILDSENNLKAYEILYKDNNKKNEKDSRYTSASVVSTILNKFGTKSLLGERRAFIKVDEKFLMNDLIFSIPNEFFVYSLVDAIEMSEKVVERLEQLHLKGYQLAIYDTVISEELFLKYREILGLLSFVKLKLTDATATTQEVIKDLKTYELKIVAVNIATEREYITAQELGCNLFQGYFFSEPKILENAKYEPSQAAILKLYNLLISDTNIEKITRAFEDNHEITLQLLQFINSGAFHFKNRISSIGHVLNLVGRIPLSQWLMLMIY
ncbi:MAG: diguanylate phosphodiesterase, partial [Bacteroidota bacterium]|nr:diguanylate phosphodiesterase [Bacteroidota bacterium]